MPLDHYITLGRSGLRVSPFALGAMTFGEDPGGAGCSVEESDKILATYLDLGGNFIDTANFYTNGHSEKILGDFFAARPGRRERVVLASKFFTNLFPGDPNGGGAGRTSIHAQLDHTLRRLQTDYLDLYWLHNWDWHTPIEETPAHPRRSRPGRQDPLYRLLQHAGLGDRTGPDHRAAERLDPADRAAGRVLAAGPHRRG
jgi:aryl-alcohol dehydrogenase-like predicted oxidoreductase